MTSIIFPGQQAPYSQEAEEALLGAVMVNPDAFLGVASFLTIDDFYILRHAYIWEALMRISERNDKADFVTVQEELRTMNRLNDIGGPAYLLQLINNTPTSVHVEVYGRLVERAAIRRRLLTAADEIKALALEEDLPIEKVTSESETRIFRVTERNLRRDIIPMREAMSGYFDRIEHLMQHPDEPMGLPTGFRDVDELLGGLQRSDLLIFAGRPGMGKCVTGDTLIPTEYGMVTIENLKPEGVVGMQDDEGGIFYPLQIHVQTPYGMQETSHFYDSGVKPTKQFQTRAGYKLAGTYVHPVLTLSPAGEKTWKTLAALEPGDYVAIQRHDSASEAVIPLQKIDFKQGRRSATYPQLHKIASYAPEVTPLLEPEFYWDEVTEVEDAGLKHCYDLTIPDGHAFVSNGIVSHNTSFLLSVALNAAKLGARIAIFTMEMGNEQIVQRFVSMETGINTQRLRTGQLNQQEWSRFVQASGRLANLRIFIDDTPAMTPIQMRTKCRRLMHEYGLDLVIVDYMQLMNSGGGYENNRVQEISFISRSLKELAREMNVPVFSAAQLSRAVEQRQDKRPLLSDLRESGCLAGDTLVYMPATGTYTPIRELNGLSGFDVLSLNSATWKLEPAMVNHAFCTGVKPVFKLMTKLGRAIRATGNHKFLTIDGWKRLDELTTADTIALPRQLSGVAAPTMSDAELALLGHLIGDGCTLPRHTTQYTTNEFELADSDVYWDGIASVEPDGESDVYDLTVPAWSNFIADNIIVHNSIEQDADIVAFLYRDAVYNEAAENPNRADIIIAKHRNGPTGTISLHFEKALTKFADARTQTIDLSSL